MHEMTQEIDLGELWQHIGPWHIGHRTAHRSTAQNVQPLRDYDSTVSALAMLGLLTLFRFLFLPSLVAVPLDTSFASDPSR